MRYLIQSLWAFSLLLHLAESGSRRACCRHIPNKSKFSQCKDACEQAWMSRGPLQQVEIFSSAYRYCPINTLVDFWQCVGTNYPVLTDVELWEGRTCCELAYSTECQLMCQGAVRRADLEQNCMAQEESALYSCVQRQNDNAACCGDVFSIQCKAACRAMFVHEGTASQILQDNLMATCTSSDSHVIQCVANRTRQHVEMTPPAQSLQCCQQSINTQCRDVCTQAFNSLSSQDSIIQAIIPACGHPISTDPLWQCFLLAQTPANRARSHDDEQSSPMDGASLQCCSKAVTSECRNLCIQLYNRRLSSVWEDFSTTCQYNSQETAMMECIQDVDEPCTVGCNQLHFCSNFNGRYMDMFRSCNSKADVAARAEYSYWLREKRIQLPNSIVVPIKDVQYCEPDTWKAIACALNIKPCDANGRSHKICKSDCISILQHCVDNSKKSYDIHSLCSQLSASDDAESCISLSQYLKPSNEDSVADLSNPCVPNLCNSSEICEPNRNYPACIASHKSCLPHVCRSACPAGDSSPLLVKSNYFLKMIDSASQGSLNCYNVCKCGHTGILTHCKQTYCESTDSCITPESLVEHGAAFVNKCNRCMCLSGETVCNLSPCSEEKPQLVASGLPCGCSANYEPVCTRNGQVFSNGCLAQCAGFTEMSYTKGNCASRNPCGSTLCPHGSKCVSDRKTCLSSRPCPQHRCIPANCDGTEHGPVCDDLGLQHPNVCILLARKRQLSYAGHCKSGCAHNSPVCGVNGETYMSECAALADNVLVDYNSPCKASPSSLVTNSMSNACVDVPCNSLPDWCEGIIPTGACCPVCGAEIRSLFSKKYVDDVTKNSDISQITTKDIADHLRHHLTNSHCDVFVHIGVGEELIVLILPVDKYPLQLQTEFCQLDAKRISHLIESRSPVLNIDVELSVLLTSDLHLSEDIASVPSSSKRCIVNNIMMLTLYLILIIAVT